MPTDTDTDIETTDLQDGETEALQAETEPVPAWAQKILESQSKAEARQGFLERKISAAERRGAPVDPALRQEVARVAKLVESNQLEEQIKNLDFTQEQEAAFRKALESKQPAVREWDEAELEAIGESDFYDKLVPKFQQAAGLAGLDLTPENVDEIHGLFRNFDLVWDGQHGGWKNLHEFELGILAKIAKTAELVQTAKKTPAQAAGKTLGDGGKPSGAAAANITYAEAIKKPESWWKSLTSEEFNRIVSSG